MSTPGQPRDDTDRSYTKPIGYVSAHELGRLKSGHDANLRSARFGPSALDGDIPVFLDVPAAVDVGAAQAETAQAAPTTALTDEQILAGYRAMLSCIEFFGPDAAIAAFRAATPGATHGKA